MKHMIIIDYYIRLISTSVLGIVVSLLFPVVCAALPNGNSIAIALEDKTQAIISINNNNVIAQLQNGETLVLVNNINNIPDYAQDIWIRDFNFDGFQDVAVTTQLDANSHEQIYTIFTWEKSLKHFVPLLFAGRLVNLELNPQSQQVQSSYQSSDFWTEDTYRYINNQPYLYSKSVLVASDLWHTTVYNQQKKIIRSLVSNNGLVNYPPNPVLLTVSNNNVPLYRQALPSTKMPISLNQGDLVTIIDFKRGLNQLYWVNVSANIKTKVLTGWTLLTNILERQDY